MKITETTGERKFTIELDEEDAGQLKALCAKPRGNMRIVGELYDYFDDNNVEEVGFVEEASDGKFYAWDSKADAEKHMKPL